MFRILRAGSAWLWLFVLALVGLLVLGLAILPETLQEGYSLTEIPFTHPLVPGIPVGLYLLSLFSLLLFIGLVVSLFLERYERPMVVLFIAARLAVIAWQYLLGRHSLLYLIGTAAAHLVIGGLVLLFFSNRLRLPPSQIGPDEEIP